MWERSKGPQARRLRNKKFHTALSYRASMTRSSSISFHVFRKPGTTIVCVLFLPVTCCCIVVTPRKCSIMACCAVFDCMLRPNASDYATAVASRATWSQPSTLDAKQTAIYGRRWCGSRLGICLPTVVNGALQVGPLGKYVDITLRREGPIWRIPFSTVTKTSFHDSCYDRGSTFAPNKFLKCGAP